MYVSGSVSMTPNVRVCYIVIYIILCITVLSYYFPTGSHYIQGTTAQRHNGTTVQWCKGTTVQRYNGLKAQGHRGIREKLRKLNH